MRPIAIEIVRGLQAAGHQAYFVGGCVRDQLLGLQPQDRIVAYVNLGYIREGATPKPAARSEPIVRWDWS